MIEATQLFPPALTRAVFAHIVCSVQVGARRPNDASAPWTQASAAVGATRLHGCSAVPVL